MHNLFILGFIVFETVLFLSFGNAEDINLKSSRHSIVPEQKINGTVTQNSTTEDVSTRIEHIPRKPDPFSAKVIVQPAMTSSSQPTERKNSTKRDSVETTNQTNSTGRPTKVQESTETTETTEKIVLKHIPRDKRDTQYEITMPYNFNTLHLPCDMDIPFKHMRSMPHHCQWLINQRFQTLQYWRAYNLMKTEAFFFGQYWERLRHYELDDHIYN